MKKQAVGVIFHALNFLVLFRIRLSLSLEYDYLTSLESNTDNDKYISGYNKDEHNEDATFLHNDISIQRFQFSHEKDSDMEDLNTEDSDTEKNVFQINCKRFNSWFNFSDTFIKTLGKGFINCPFTTCLNFKANQIESIASGAFDGLPDLQYLNLAGNSISSLLPFNGHNNLKILILANQSEYHWRKLEIYGEYPELGYLDLSGNYIDSINRPSNYQNFYNHLNEKSAFPKLRYLDLSNNYLGTFDGHFLLKHSITNLYLTNNQFEFVDLSMYSNLVELGLEHNNFRGIKQYRVNQYVCISEMPRLKYLLMSNNQIKRIDENIFEKMPKLVTLDLSNNQLNTFIISKHKFGSLRNIYLDKNELYSISMTHRLSNLTILSMAFNKFETLVSNFVNAPNLKKLYIGNNEIKVIHENAFSKLELLEELHLNNNYLDKLPTDWCQNLRSLRYLNLSNNTFTTLESLSLRQSLSVIQIDFINNHLIYMKADVWQNLPENATIYLMEPQSENNALSKRSL